MRASEVARVVVGSFEGDNDPVLRAVHPLDGAGPEDLAFLAHTRYLPYLSTTRAGAILVVESLADRVPAHIPRILVADVHAALATLLPRFYPAARPEPGVHATAVIGSGARLGEEVCIGPFAVVGPRVRLGDRCQIGAHSVLGEDCDLDEEVVLHPHVTLYPGVRIGTRSIIHSGCRVGVDGFGYVMDGDGWRKIPQVGSCIIGSDVELGANVTVDRGSIGVTEIRDGVKIDNLVQIGHNVRIGDQTIVVAQVGIAGSTVVGRRATLGGQAGIVGHITIGDGAVIAAQAGVIGDVPAGAVFSGYPARPHREALRGQAAIKRLPRMIERVQALERALFKGEVRDE